jgi:hypothetical protein
MLNLFRSKPDRTDGHALVKALLDEVERTQDRHLIKLEDSAVGRDLLAAPPETHRAFVLAAAAWLRHKESFYIREAMLTILRRSLPFTREDVLALLDFSLHQRSNQSRATSQMIKVLEEYLEEHPESPEVRGKAWELAEAIEAGYCRPEDRRWAARLRELADPEASRRLPLVPGEAWSDAALADIQAMDPATSAAWAALLTACAQAPDAQPNARWLKLAQEPMEAIGFEGFKQAVLRWFPLVDRPRTQPAPHPRLWPYDPDPLIDEANADVLRGLAWLCAGREDREIARALVTLAVSAYRKVPQKGPRCPRVGNACVWALANMPGSEGVAELARLQARVKVHSVPKTVAAALDRAAERAGLPREEIEELSVPTYGLQEVGLRREPLGDYTAELVVTDTFTAELHWVRPDGKQQAGIPKAVKEQCPEELKELTEATKSLREMLMAQRDRIERLFLARRSWTLPIWRERYLDHPLVGTLARRLIWTFSRGDRAASGIWHEGWIVGRDGQPLSWLDDATRVELWHPLHVHPEVVLEWRDWLVRHEVRQPFKQAHREVYLLTEAERGTGIYSNRFAGHVLRQHQFHALCGARGWMDRLRLRVDEEFPPATRLLPEWGLRAEFWVEGAGGDLGTYTNVTGTYLYVSTDQVRFYPLAAPGHLVQGNGGADQTGRYGAGDPAQPLPLEQIPPLVFSEVMRDVDLFVGVASVGNDPTWFDGGPEGRYRGYWERYAFGELSEVARTRKQVLEQLVPRLKIAERCRVEGNYLVVRGDLHTYRIHLGSGNIVMEPSNRHLCIVPAQGAAWGGPDVFVPFEGDGMLSVILSMAFLLANDRSIKDPTILQQIDP